MKKVHFGAGFAIFLLFFGFAMIAAFKAGSLYRIMFWIMIGLLFVLADNMKKDNA